MMASDRSLFWLKMLAGLGATLVLAVMAVRAGSAISYVQALQVTTSGAEWESLLPLWRKAHGAAAYLDRHAPPFNSAHYNWLFYELFGTVPGRLMALLGWGDAWLPTVARHVSILGMAVGVWFGWRTLRAAAPAYGGMVTLALAVLVAVGPVVGWWGLTARPDLLAMTFEIVAVAAFLALVERRPVAAALAAALFCYLAWSLKQINVTAAGGIGLTLLYRRQWRAAFVLAGASVAAWVTTFAVGEAQFVRNLLFSGYPIVYVFERLLRNLGNLTVKILPILLPLAVLAPLWFRHWRVMLARPHGQLGLFGSLVAGVLTIPTSAHTGAAENYYFTLVFFLALLLSATLAELAPGQERRPRLAMAVGWVASVVLSLLVLSGKVGVTDLRAEDALYRRMQTCLAPVPRPLFVDVRYMALPWMTPGPEPYYVLSFVYDDERKLGRAFEGGGIGGRIERGEFAALAFHAAQAPESYDGALLSGYVPLADNPCDDISLKILLRADRAGAGR